MLRTQRFFWYFRLSICLTGRKFFFSSLFVGTFFFSFFSHFLTYEMCLCRVMYPMNHNINYISKAEWKKWRKKKWTPTECWNWKQFHRHAPWQMISRHGFLSRPSFFLLALCKSLCPRTIKKNARTVSNWQTIQKKVSVMHLKTAFKYIQAHSHSYYPPLIFWFWNEKGNNLIIVDEVKWLNINTYLPMFVRPNSRLIVQTFLANFHLFNLYSLFCLEF